jgi:hypothetical protein
VLRRFLLIILLWGSLAASLPSLAQAAGPCSPAKPAATPIAITSHSIGTLQISWELSKPSPTSERVLYSSEQEAGVKVHSNEPGLENGTARSTELTQLRQGEPYKVVLVLEYHSCTEEKSEGNDAAFAYSLAPAVHWYNCPPRIGTGEYCPNWKQWPQGEHVTIQFYGPTSLKTVKGTQKGNYVYCNKLNADGIIENPVGGGTGNQTITSFETSECSQSGYCAAGEIPAISIKGLTPTTPLVTDTFEAANGYRFEHMKMAFVVQCSGKAVANVVAPPLGPPLLGYLSNGGYSVEAPANLDLDDGPGLGGENVHYETQYGNGGNLELEGSSGTQIVQPGAYWSYLGYGSFLNEVIPTNAP